MELSPEPVFNLNLINLEASTSVVEAYPLTIELLTSAKAPLLARITDFMIRTYRGVIIFSGDEPSVAYFGAVPIVDKHLLAKFNSKHVAVDGKLYTIGVPRWDFVDDAPVLSDIGRGLPWDEKDWNAVYQNLRDQGQELEGWPSHNPLQLAKPSVGRMEPGKHFEQRTP